MPRDRLPKTQPGSSKGVSPSVTSDDTETLVFLPSPSLNVFLVAALEHSSKYVGATDTVIDSLVSATIVNVIENEDVTVGDNMVTDATGKPKSYSVVLKQTAHGMKLSYVKLLMEIIIEEEDVIEEVA
ncbi:hypothetical protein vseg_011726 [Gypsophila vaccaria]